LPPIESLREVALAIAIAVAGQAEREGLATARPEAYTPAAIAQSMWVADYQ
jgi:malate dehydrogenase (oxaloacetate-decarboxylating)